MTGQCFKSHVEVGPVRASRNVVGILLVCASLLSGCSSTSNVPPAPKQDEAMQRAAAERISVADAADYFTYRTYADGDSDPHNTDTDNTNTDNTNTDNTDTHNTDAYNIDAYHSESSRSEAGKNRSEYDSAQGNAKSYPHAADYFRGMDGISLPVGTDGEPLRDTAMFPDQLLDCLGGNRQQAKVVDPQLGGHNGDHSEIIGRNTWMVWCGGNEGFWDYLATDSLGFVDFIKLVDSRKRATRFETAGVINEPGMRESKVPGKYEFGLYLDQPDDPEAHAWRQAYLEQTFQRLAAGKHKSQIGLKQRNAYGDFEGPPLYQGDPLAYEGERGYLYPSQYLAKAESGGYARATATAGYSHSTAGYSNKLDEVIPPPDLYGISSGIIGLRLFPNPYFDAEAQRKWDPDRFHSDKSYWTDPKLIRPFRVGMSCAFCHASFHPLRPPHDITKPEWENLSGNIGAQYLSMRGTVGNLLEPDNFVYHLLDSQPRGTIDTSLVASDNINNPNTMNAVFGLRQRAILSLSNPQERLDDASAKLPSLWDDLTPDGQGQLGKQINDPVPAYWGAVASNLGVVDRIEQSNDNPRFVPRILLDGSDSIGTWGALARVYLNIGTYWEQWNEIHQVVIGFEPQRPFTIADCKTNSVYWNATERRVPGLRDYFLRVTSPMPLLSTPGAGERLASIDHEVLRQQAKDTEVDYQSLYAKTRSQHLDLSKLKQGRRAFAENCIICHSSIQPESAATALIAYDPIKMTADDPLVVETEKTRVRELRHAYEARFKPLIAGRQKYHAKDEATGEFWEHDPARWQSDAMYREWACDAVENPEFWRNNYLSNDYRIPINVVGTNSARAMATNAMQGHMWQDFASDSYRMLPSPGEIPYFNPYKGFAGEMDTYSPRHRTPNGAPLGGGGPGYYRVPSLISIWATAPFLHNNSLGLYNNDPSVKGRLEAFDDAIRKLLWPEKRLESSSYNGATADRLQRDHGLIWRTPAETYLKVDAKRVPTIARNAIGMSYQRSVPGLRWLQIVFPTWFPSSVLLTGALLVLLLSNSSLKPGVALGVFILGVLFTAARWIAISSPGLSLFVVLRSTDLWMPVIALAIVGFVLWLPLWQESKLRWAGCLILIGTILLGLLGVVARAWPQFSFGNALRSVSPGWMPLVVFTSVAGILLLPLSPTWTRIVGYATTALAVLVGVFVLFNAGELGDIAIGPIPKGTPVNLLANFNSEADRKTQIESLHTVAAGLAELKGRNLSPAETQKIMRTKVAPALMRVNKCPDFVMDRGHYFPWFDTMSDDDKNALIELLKTF